MRNLLRYLWKGKADGDIENEEYKSMLKLADDFGADQEKGELDIVFDTLQEGKNKL